MIPATATMTAAGLNQSHLGVSAVNSVNTSATWCIQDARPGPGRAEPGCNHWAARATPYHKMQSAPLRCERMTAMEIPSDTTLFITSHRPQQQGSPERHAARQHREDVEP